MSRIVLGVGGGIAAYKSVTLLRLLVESGHDVTVVPTTAALEFVGAPTWSALSHHPVVADVWTDTHDVPHVALGRHADLVVVAPATADLLGRAANGLADDLLTNVLLTVRAPVLMAPAMHTEMWEHPAVQDNVARLRARGVTVLEPAIGRLTGADTGSGRLPEPAEIAQLAELLLVDRAALPPDLVGRRVVVTAGGTREPLDPVRYLGNNSSGRQGYALSTVAAARGARVTLIAANCEWPDPAGSVVVPVGTAAELRAATVTFAAGADIVIMAAAVADFRPTNEAKHKIKRGAAEPEPVALTRNSDILAELVALRRDAQLSDGHGGSGPISTVLVGFAAETGDDEGDVITHGRAKLVRKGCDLLVVNQVGPQLAFGRPDNAALILGADGSEVVVALGPKAVLAAAVWDAAGRVLAGKTSGSR